MGFDIEFIQVVDGKMVKMAEDYFSYNWSDLQEYFYIRDVDQLPANAAKAKISSALKLLQDNGHTIAKKSNQTEIGLGEFAMEKTFHKKKESVCLCCIYNVLLTFLKNILIVTCALIFAKVKLMTL